MALRDIVGQEKALRIFFGALRRNRVPSAILLSGDAGIGKRLAAINYAKAINCVHPIDLDCCDKCNSCKKIDAGIHLDVSIIIPENDEIRIEVIRRIEESLSLKASEGKKKVIIIEGAEAMNIYAANAFLKTLEEPSPDDLIMLISSNPDMLLDTIRSRCINIRFYPLPLDKCRDVISKNIKAEEMDFMLNLSMGRPGFAMSGNFKKEREWFMELLNDMIYQALRKSKNRWADKGEIKLWLDMASILLRDIVVFKITCKEDAILLNSKLRVTDNSLINDDKSKGLPLAARCSMSGILSAHQELQRIRGLLDFNLNKSITWNYVSTVMRQAVKGSKMEGINA